MVGGLSTVFDCRLVPLTVLLGMVRLFYSWLGDDNLYLLLQQFQPREHKCQKIRFEALNL